MNTFIQRIFSFGIMFARETDEHNYPETSTALILNRLATFTKIPNEVKDLANSENEGIQSHTG